MGQSFQVALPLQAAAAGTTGPYELAVVPSFESTDNDVEKISVTSPSLVTGVPTNTGTLNVRQLRAGAVVQTLGSLALLAGTNLAAEVEVNVPITPTNPSTLQSGDVIDVNYVQIGTGLALPAGVVVKVELE